MFSHATHRVQLSHNFFIWSYTFIHREYEGVKALSGKAIFVSNVKIESGFIKITFEYKNRGGKLTRDRLTQIYLIWHFLPFRQSVHYWLFGGQDTRLTGQQVWLKIAISILYTRKKTPRNKELQKQQRKRHQKSESTENMTTTKNLHFKSVQTLCWLAAEGRISPLDGWPFHYKSFQ